MDVKRRPLEEGPPEDEFIEVKAEAVHCVLGRDMAGMREQLRLLPLKALRGFKEQLNFIVSEASRQEWARQVAARDARTGATRDDGGHDDS